MDVQQLVDDQHRFDRVAPAMIRRGSLSVAAPAVLPRKGTIEPLADAAGAAFRETQWFSLPQLQGGFEPQPGDVLETGPGRSWTLVQTESCAGGARFRCLAARSTISAEAVVELTISAAAAEQDAAGAVVRTWQVIGVLQAAVVPLPEGLVDEHGGTRPRGEVLIFFAAPPVALHAGMRLRDGGAAPYAVLSVEPPREAAGLWRARAVQSAWPLPQG